MKSGERKTLTFICESKNPRLSKGFCICLINPATYIASKIPFKVVLGRMAFATSATSGL